MKHICPYCGKLTDRLFWCLECSTTQRYTYAVWLEQRLIEMRNTLKHERDIARRDFKTHESIIAELQNKQVGLNEARLTEISQRNYWADENMSTRLLDDLNWCLETIEKLRGA